MPLYIVLIFRGLHEIASNLVQPVTVIVPLFQQFGVCCIFPKKLQLIPGAQNEKSVPMLKTEFSPF